MAGHNIAPIPRENPIARQPRERGDKLAGMPTDIWGDYLERQVETLNRKPTRMFEAELGAQDASISAADITDGTISAGLYRVMFYARIARAASVSSSLEVEIGWTDDGVAQVETYTAIIGNTTASHQTATLLIRSDEVSPVTYRTTYASAGATTMLYYLAVTMEFVKS